MNNIEELYTRIINDDNIMEDTKETLLYTINNFYIESENSNKIYVSALKDSIFKYKGKIKDTKKLIKDKEYTKAISNIKELRRTLDEMERKVKEAPDTLSEALLSQLYKAILDTVVFTLAMNVAKELAKKAGLQDALNRTAKELKNNKNATEEEKKMAKALEKLSNKDKSEAGIVGNFVANTGFTMGTNIALNKLTSKAEDKSFVPNRFKAKALKALQKNRKALDKLEKQLISLTK